MEVGSLRGVWRCLSRLLFREKVKSIQGRIQLTVNDEVKAGIGKLMVFAD